MKYTVKEPEPSAVKVSWAVDPLVIAAPPVITGVSDAAKLIAPTHLPTLLAVTAHHPDEPVKVLHPPQLDSTKSAGVSFSPMSRP